MRGLHALLKISTNFACQNRNSVRESDDSKVCKSVATCWNLTLLLGTSFSRDSLSTVKPICRLSRHANIENYDRAFSREIGQHLQRYRCGPPQSLINNYSYHIFRHPIKSRTLTIFRITLEDSRRGSMISSSSQCRE